MSYAPEINIEKEIQALKENGLDIDSEIMEIRDNGGPNTENGSIDRYCVVFWTIGSCCGRYYDMTCMNTIPFHPQMGFFQHCTGTPGKHNGKLISFYDLPEDCQKAMIQDLQYHIP